MRWRTRFLGGPPERRTPTRACPANGWGQEAGAPFVLEGEGLGAGTEALGDGSGVPGSRSSGEGVGSAGDGFGDGSGGDGRGEGLGLGPGGDGAVVADGTGAGIGVGTGSGAGSGQYSVGTCCRSIVLYSPGHQEAASSPDAGSMLTRTRSLAGRLNPSRGTPPSASSMKALQMAAG